MTAVFFSIKYSLANNGLVREIATDESASPGYVREKDAGWYAPSLKVGRDAFLDSEAALNAVKALRDKRVASLKKQIAKLEAMQFLIAKEQP